MQHMQINKKPKGFTLIEIIIALAIMGVAISGMLYYQSRAETGQKVNDVVSAMTTMVGGIKTSFAPAGNYDAVTSANIVNAGLTVEPFVASGTTIIDPWGTTLSIAGKGAFFGMQVSAPDKETCTKLVTSLVRNASRMTVGSDAAMVGTATTLEAFATGTNIAKADAASAYNPASSATGCSATGAKIVVVYR